MKYKKMNLILRWKFLLLQILDSFKILFILDIKSALRTFIWWDQRLSKELFNKKKTSERLSTFKLYFLCLKLCFIYLFFVNNY